MGKICLLVLHGIGVQKNGYADEFVESVRREFEALTGQAGAFFSESCLYADILDSLETSLWERFVGGKTQLRYQETRKFVVSYLADALIYQPLPNDRSPYTDIHREVIRSIRRLAEKAGPGAVLCIAAHSLGSVIMSNFLWDATVKPELLIRCEELRSEMTPQTWDLIDSTSYVWTFGSPLALWSARFKEPKAIKVPGKKANYLRTGGWRNLVDPDDILAYPLSGIGQSREYIRDIEMEVGNLLTGWNPGSHVGYWRSKMLLNMIAHDASEVWRQSQSVQNIG